VKKIAIGIGVAAALILVTAASAEPTYVGSDKCKMCHKVEYESWASGPHAGAFGKLSAEDQGKAECLKCHATGGNAELPGVGCESCHGPGSDYKSMKVMKDEAAAVAAGLIIPDATTCKGCHEGAPHEVPAFDFEKAKAKGMHEVKKKG